MPKRWEESATGWRVEEGEFRLGAVTLDTAEPLLRILLPRDTLDSVPIVDVWTTLLTFATIPAKDGELGLSFQVRFVDEGERAADVLVVRQLRQGTDPSWPPMAAGYQLLYVPRPEGLTECAMFSQDHTTARAFVTAVEQSQQFRLLAERSTAEVIVAVAELE